MSKTGTTPHQPLEAARIVLIRPPHPGPGNGVMMTDEESAGWRALQDHAGRTTSYRRLRDRAHLADPKKLNEALNELAQCNGDREHGCANADTPEIARCARAVAREADRLTALAHLREVETAWVECGVARWAKAQA